MIKLTIFYGANPRVKISGHSPKQLGEKGNNLLCAGVSVLAQTIFLYLWERGKIQSFQREEGHLEFEISEISSFVQIALEILTIGFKDLQIQYPNLISIEIGGKNGT